MYARHYLKQIEICEYRIKNPRLAGLTILHMTDLHNVVNPKVLQICQAIRPDIIVDTGDTVDELSSIADVWRLAEFYKKLPAPIYRINGNHDRSSRWYRKFKNQMAKLKVIEVKGSTPVKISKKGLVLTLGRLQDACDIALIHNPADIEKPGMSISAKIILAGHTHGGLIRPFGKIILPKNHRTGLKYPAGRFNLPAGNVMIVSKGVGFSTPRLRWRARPDVGVIRFTA